MAPYYHRHLPNHLLYYDQILVTVCRLEAFFSSVARRAQPSSQPLGILHHGDAPQPEELMHCTVQYIHTGQWLEARENSALPAPRGSIICFYSGRKCFSTWSKVEPKLYLRDELCRAEFNVGHTING